MNEGLGSREGRRQVVPCPRQKFGLSCEAQWTFAIVEGEEVAWPTPTSCRKDHVEGCLGALVSWASAFGWGYGPGKPWGMRLPARRGTCFPLSLGHSPSVRFLSFCQINLKKKKSCWQLWGEGETGSKMCAEAESPGRLLSVGRVWWSCRFSHTLLSPVICVNSRSAVYSLTILGGSKRIICVG